MIKYLVLTVFMLFCFMLIILAGTLIPKNCVWEKCGKAYEKIEQEGLYPSIFDSQLGFYDNWTNSYYIGIIANQDGNHPLKSAVGNYISNWDILEDEDVIDGLGKTFSKEKPRLSPYSNYWLGIVFVYKLLLVFFSWTQIRYIFYLVVSILIFFVSREMFEKVGNQAEWAFILMASIMCYGYLATCFAAVSDVITTLVCCELILIKSGNIRDKFLFCYILGMLNFFIAYLYAPILPIAMTLVLFTIFSLKNEVKRSIIVKENVLCGILWTLGYGITAGFKQLLSLIIIGNQSGTRKLVAWTKGGIKDRIWGLLVPFTRFIYKPVFAFIVLFIFTVAILLITKKIKIDLDKNSVINMIMVILPAFVLPVIWFLFLARATVHGFYVQNLGPLVFALLFTAFSLIQKRETKRENY